MNNNQLYSKRKEEYENTENNNLNEIPQSMELSCDEEEQEQEINQRSCEYIKSKTEEERDDQQYQFNNLISDHCITFFINQTQNFNNNTVNIDYDYKIKESIYILNNKDKQLQLLTKQNNQLKITISNLIIQSKQRKVFDKINKDNKLGLTYAEMILELPSLRKELEIKKAMINESENKLKRVILSLENTEEERKVLEDKNAKMQKTIDNCTKTNNRLKKENEMKAILVQDKQNQLDTISNQLTIYYKLNEKKSILNQITQEDNFYYLYNSKPIDKENENENVIKQKQRDQLIKDLSTELEKERERNKEFEKLNNEKSLNEKVFQKDIDSLLRTMDSYENEIKHLNYRINELIEDKTKNETFHLNQISQLQNERNYFESLIHFSHKDNETTSSLSFTSNITKANQSTISYNQAEVLHDVSHTLTESCDAFNQLKNKKEIDNQMLFLLLKNIIKTLDIAYSSMTQFNNDLQSYRNESQKLYDNHQSLNYRIDYLNSIINLLLNKHISNQSIGITIRSLISKQLEMDSLQKEKHKLKVQLSTYVSFIQTMNSTSINKESQSTFGYNQNYSQKDFSEISSYNNSLMGIEININQTHSDILGLENELNSY